VRESMTRPARIHGFSRSAHGRIAQRTPAAINAGAIGSDHTSNMTQEPGTKKAMASRNDRMNPPADELNITVPVRPTPHWADASSGTATAMRYPPDANPVAWIARLSGGAALPDIRMIVPLYLADSPAWRNCACSPNRN